MTKNKIDAVHLIEDVIQIAKWLSWGDGIGRKYSDDLVDTIHKGKYDSVEGVWIQTERAMKLLTKDIKLETDIKKLEWKQICDKPFCGVRFNIRYVPEWALREASACRRCEYFMKNQRG